MKKILLLILIAISFQTFGQDRYVIFLKDKINSPYYLSNPTAFLSAKAIARKNAMNISIDSTDIPVNPSYIQSIANTGAKILNTSRWFNTVTVQADTQQVINIGALPYVSSYKKVYGTNLFRAQRENKFESFYKEENNTVNNFQFIGNYGGADNQVKMIKADQLHLSNYTGRSMTIAVIDAGFRNANTHKAFDSLRAQNKILGTWDFSRNHPYVYDFSNHGTSVLSCISANVPDSMIGTAPHASVYLLRSEEEAEEYIVEEYNWLAAAEFADSVGVDIINSSLGYTTYDANSQSHDYTDLDGNTTLITRAANIASNKGILVVNSAGNSGSNPWFYIGAPADGTEVFSIGSVGFDQTLSSFSSHGPTSAGLTKPDVVAQGGPSFIARANTGSFGYGSGTSFSGPIIAGFSACAWELYKTNHPQSKPSELKAWIKMYSNNASTPNNDYGWGLPDGAKLLLNTSIEANKSERVYVYPNPNKGFLQINLEGQNNINYQLNITDLLGKVLYTQTFSSIELLNGIELPYYITNGIYILSLESDTNNYKIRFIRE